jgi:nicotinate-nucleotide pyrophosphorylase (carboxylating)
MKNGIASDLSIFDYIAPDALDRYLEYVFEEDFGDRGDITSDVIFQDCVQAVTGKIMAKAAGIVAGVELFAYIVQKLDPHARFEIICHDGSRVEKGDEILRVTAQVASLLKAERIGLNFLGGLSGVATITNQFVEKLRGTRCRVLDTRKTTPGIRFAEKYAVRVGGGTNHRMGLYDVIMVKDNHIDGGDGITACVYRLRSVWGDRYDVIVEARNIDEVEEALALNVDRILLDNMSIATMEKAVALVNGKIALEASGNITLENAREVAQTGVDFISTSYITAWAQPLDLSLIIL